MGAGKVSVLLLPSPMMSCVLLSCVGQQSTAADHKVKCVWQQVSSAQFRHLVEQSDRDLAAAAGSEQRLWQTVTE